MPWMYILQCGDGSFYVGSTRDLARRMEEHALGIGGLYTSQRLPVRLVYYEEYPNIRDAFFREKQVQGWSRAKRIALINTDYDQLPRLAKKRYKNK
jgi:putative endonuclease